MTKVTDVIEQSDDGSGLGQGMSAEYEIIDGHPYHHLEAIQREKIQRNTGETVAR